MLLSLALGCSLLTALATWRSLLGARLLEGQAQQVRRAAAVLREAQAQDTRLRQLARAQQLGETAVDLGAGTAHAVHESIAAIPFGILEALPVVSGPARVVRVLHDAIAGGIYRGIRAANRLAGRSLRGELGQPQDGKKP